MALSTGEIIRAMASDDFDMLAYERSESFKTINDFQQCRNAFPDESAPEVLAYWRERGLIKELHNADDPGNKWASYLPVSESDDQNNAVHPLLFVLHGANNPIYLAEAYGYTHLAAKEKLIVIIPENESPEFIDQLFEYARTHYPVDWTRVYMVGYSLGGIMTSRHALRWPERFAAVGIGGMLFANGTMNPYPHLGVTWPAETITHEMIEHAAKVKIPMCCCLGEQEFDHVLPIYKGDPIIAPGSDGKSVVALDLSAKNKMTSVNNWRHVAGCKSISLEDVPGHVQASADIVVEKLGFPFENTSVKTFEGRSQFIGDCVNSDGEVLARFVCIAKSSHWPCAGLVDTTWSFIKKFARDEQTHLSCCLEPSL